MENVAAKAAAGRGFKYYYAVLFTLSLLTLIQPAYADNDNEQAPVIENQLGQKSKKELLDIMERLVARHPEIKKELLEQQNKQQQEEAVSVAKEPEEAAKRREEEQQLSWVPKVLGLQFNGVYQNVPGFHSPYAGDNSFRTDEGLGHNITHIYGLYLGSQLAPTLQAYIDIEMAKGSGVSKGQGLGGYVNGDVIRVGSVDLGTGPYIARAYLRYFYPLSAETEKVERAMDQLLGNEPVNRFEIKA